MPTFLRVFRARRSRLRPSEIHSEISLPSSVSNRLDGRGNHARSVAARPTCGPLGIRCPLSQRFCETQLSARRLQKVSVCFFLARINVFVRTRFKNGVVFESCLWTELQSPTSPSTPSPPSQSPLHYPTSPRLPHLARAVKSTRWACEINASTSDA